ncbi:DNA-binding response OmpR family regulator [Lachnotalea glycerini]|uniref:Stage 0 sporulation protein A homolog n=1 Tax=Lachnotalea glycerini TaxID=1763509 RepID=A0A255IHC0_9FIRM|nr:response regulator transcription factor [Lachnotalea glycerini]OYO42638.1 DNA-binding response regulator [Lachnotalea glycerini]PXV90181.1 DNA-binding response OmpR family regulator [Lachnotalea glycerini]RDY31759.1 DNA-binding response regulator [Lachnotalea glycerini]
MMKGKILIADDEIVLGDLLQDILEKEGYYVLKARDGEEALELYFESEDIDLVILDVLMPKVDGWKVLEEIREYSNVPIIMLTALSESKDEVEGLTNGADDYIAKPFSYEVLLARVNTQFRRNNIEQTEPLIAGNISINQLKQKVYVNAKFVRLNNKEYQLLIYLVKNKGIVLNRYQIVTTIWGYDYEGSERTVDTHIKMIRSKLGECGDYIKTMRGQGYSFEIY